MEKFEINILGCGSALPTTRHFPTSQVVNVRDKLYMIDCGEGAQLQLRRSRLKFNRLNHIFISHLHGDHCFGLPGLISTFSLLGRTATLHIHAPAALETFLDTLQKSFCQNVGYRIALHAIDTETHSLIYEDRSVTVHSLPLRHRIPCCGFLFTEKQSLPHIRREMIDFYHIPDYEINRIKAGADWTTPDGTVIANNRLTRPAAPARSYAYCSDTLYSPQLLPYINKVDLLFHEATFTEEHALRAQETCHSTARQAAIQARDCGAGRLCIGHFSARYEDETPLLEEARSVFPHTLLATEGMVLTL